MCQPVVLCVYLSVCSVVHLFLVCGARRRAAGGWGKPGVSLSVFSVPPLRYTHALTKRTRTKSRVTHPFKNTRKPVHIPTHKHADTLTHGHVGAYTQTHTQITHVHTQTSAHIDTHTHTCRHTHAHTYTGTHSRARSHTLWHTHTFSNTNTQTHRLDFHPTYLRLFLP